MIKFSWKVSQIGFILGGGSWKQLLTLKTPLNCWLIYDYLSIKSSALSRPIYSACNIFSGQILELLPFALQTCIFKQLTNK
mgnify:CR=1 FL=1